MKMQGSNPTRRPGRPAGIFPFGNNEVVSDGTENTPGQGRSDDRRTHSRKPQETRIPESARSGGQPRIRICAAFRKENFNMRRAEVLNAKACSQCLRFSVSRSVCVQNREQGRGY